MDTVKSSALIRALRREKGWTQQELADQLHVSARAVSKWETAGGFPDVSILPALSRLLGVDVEALLQGETGENETVAGNLNKARFHVCPNCGNLSICTGSAAVSCCGRPLSPLSARRATDEEMLRVESVEDEWFLTSAHPMRKEDYISFVAMLTGERLELLQTYPEWELSLRIPKRAHGKLLWFSTKHGLLWQPL